MKAQTLTETLQKQVWPGSTRFSTHAWESLLPTCSSDTLFYADGAVAEVIELTADGLPHTVLLLHREADGWIPKTKTKVDFGPEGSIVGLASWYRELGNWLPESLTLRAMDENGNEEAFELRYWEDGGWTTVYASKPILSPASPSAQLGR